MNILTRLTLTSLLTLLLLPASALAAPAWDEGTDWPAFDYGIAGYKYGFDIPVADEAVCSDDRYDEDTEEYVDTLGNNYSMVGSRAAVETLTASGWQEIASRTVTRDDVYADCEEGFVRLDGDEGFRVGYSYPAERTQMRVTFSGAAGALQSPAFAAYPIFGSAARWAPGPAWPMEIRKGYVTVDVTKVDLRLVGTKVTVLLSPAKGKPYKAIATKTIKRKGKYGTARVQFKTPKKRSWAGYACLDYTRFPQMNTGAACPKGTVSKAQLEKLFPGSTTGY